MLFNILKLFELYIAAKIEAVKASCPVRDIDLASTAKKAQPAYAITPSL
jgi:hypothetical protein